jgi:hypothetical protein
LSLATVQQFALPHGLEALPKGVHGAIQIEDYSCQCLQSGLMRRRNPHHNPAGGIALIPN